MKTVHFVGIGGIGMSALARFYLSQGIKVSGSDMSDSEILHELSNEGAVIFNEHKLENVPKNCDLIVFSEAIPENNPERVFAKENNISQQSYFKALGEISEQFKTIAIAGTHGKSSTTAMTGLALEKAEKDPTVFIGTKVFEWGNKNFRPGKSNILVAEACEYRNSFLNLHPEIAVITTMEPEHLDFFENAENYFKAFEKFIQKSKTLVADFTDENIKKIADNFMGTKIDSSKFISQVPELQIPGKHYIEDASKVFGVFEALHIPFDTLKESLSDFHGTWRRFEKKGDINGVIIFDDYGHHPTEVRVTLNALREKYPKQKIFCVFQPHQYSRTKHFLKEFGSSFTSADEVLIPNIYRVRDSEDDVASVSVADLVSEIKNGGTKARHSENFEKTAEILKNEMKPGDVIITMGAGPVDQVISNLRFQISNY